MNEKYDEGYYSLPGSRPPLGYSHQQAEDWKRGQAAREAYIPGTYSAAAGVAAQFLGFLIISCIIGEYLSRKDSTLYSTCVFFGITAIYGLVKLISWANRREATHAVVSSPTRSKAPTKRLKYAAIVLLLLSPYIIYKANEFRINYNAETEKWAQIAQDEKLSNMVRQQQAASESTRPKHKHVSGRQYHKAKGVHSR